jgi:hypothetical protein
LHPEGVSESGPGEGSELVDPLLVEKAAFRDSVRHVDREVGEVEGFGWLVW